jgi:hypothetical protein
MHLARAFLPRKHFQMNEREARRHALSEWLMEFSVLWAVFPLLDQFVGNRPIDVSVIAWSVRISLTALVAGVILRKGELT